MPIDVATGAVHFDLEDFRIPGRFPLTWARRYHTGLTEYSEGPFGPGWTNDFFSKLTRVGKEYHFIGPSGFITRFTDPDGIVEREGIVRNPGSFQEIRPVGPYLQVVKWSTDGRIQRFRFLPGRNGDWWRLRSIEDDKGNGVELAWDEKGRLRGARQSQEKRTLAFTYSDSGRITAAAFRYPDGRMQEVSRYGYDERGFLVSAYDASGHADRYEYDKEGRLARELAKDGGVFSYRYDDAGRCIRAGGLDNYDLKVLRYLDTARMTEVTNSLGKTTRYQHLATGQIVMKLDPLGGKTETVYDGFGRIISRTGPCGETTAYEYDAAGNRSKLIDALGNASEFRYNDRHQAVEFIGADGSGWKKEYDDAGRPIKAIDAMGNESAIEYDPSGNPVLLRNPEGAVSRRVYSEIGDPVEITDWSGKKTRLAHDALGRVIRRLEPNGLDVRREYDLQGRVLSCAYGDGRRFTYAYDAAGNIVEAMGPAGQSVRFRYGSCRRLLEKRVGAGLVRRYTWGSEPDRLERIENEAGETYAFRYDACDRIIAETGFDGRTTGFKYDASGRCIGKTNPAGQAILWELDPLGKVLKETAGEDITEFGYDAAGRIISAGNAWGRVVFTRDAGGRILEEDQAGIGIRRTFGPTGGVLTLESDLGARFAYGHDANGLVTSIDANGLGRFGLERNDAGQLHTLAFPGEGRMEYTYDSRARLIGQQALHGAEMVFERRYEYAETGALASIEDSEWARTRFHHDDAQRLIGYETQTQSARYRLDKAGNPVAAILDGLREETLSYAPGGTLLGRGAWKYSYDDAGRLVRKESAGSGESPRIWTFAWDVKDRLRSMTDPEGGFWEYGYDAFGRRLSKRGPGKEIRYVWDHDVLLHEVEDGGGPRTWGFEPSGFKPLFRIQGGKLASVLTDHLGTPMRMLDAAGKCVWSVQFDPFGNPIRGNENLQDCPFRLQGQYFDPESGLHYNRFRYYDPGTGGYISRDPILLAGGVAPYQYAPDPTRTCDPLGLCEETLYRTMSQEDFDELQRTGRMPATTETTTSPTRSFSEDYDGVLVEFKLQPGTIAELEAIGVRDDGKLTREKYPDMPVGGKGWNKEHARFKQEGDQINIALGKGDALDIFNDNIVSYNAVRP